MSGALPPVNHDDVSETKHGSNHRTVESPTPTNRNPDRQIDRSDWGNFCRIDDSRLGVVKRPCDAGDHGSGGEDEQLVGVRRDTPKTVPALRRREWRGSRSRICPPASTQRIHSQRPARTAEAQKNQSDSVACDTASRPGMFCKPDSPLLPRSPVSFWNR